MVDAIMVKKMHFEFCLNEGDEAEKKWMQKLEKKKKKNSWATWVVNILGHKWGYFLVLEGLLVCLYNGG